MNTCIKIEIIKINKKVKSVKVIIDQLEKKSSKSFAAVAPHSLAGKTNEAN